LKCRSCRKGRYAPPVHVIKLTQEREITPYVWGHPDEERMRAQLRSTLQKFADEVMATARREMTRDETNYIPQHARPVTGGRKPFKSEILADRKERFAGINKFVTERGGWLTSVPGERAVEMHCLADSTLPDELRKLG
jgi:hypothetical protein